MKYSVIAFFVIYMTAVNAMTELSVDLRFPIDAKVIQGKLTGRILTHVYYQLNENKTVIEYFVRDMFRSCGVNRIEMDKNYRFASFQIFPLNKNKILLVPIAHDTKFNQHPVKIVIVDVVRCQKAYVVLPTEEIPNEFQITKYADSFDIYYKDSTVCNNNYCRKSYDFQGNLISPSFNEFHSNKSVPLVKPIGSEMRSNNYVAFEFTKEKNIFNLVKSKETKILTEIKDTQFSPQVSTSNNRITIAYRFDFTNLNLMQFDLEGNVKFQTLVKYEYFVRTARVLNVPNGGVYLIASECDRDHCNDEMNVYSLKQFDANGNEVGSIHFKLPLPGIIEDLSFYEDKDSYCLTRAQLSLGVSGTWQFKKLDIITKCFNDKDFS